MCQTSDGTLGTTTPSDHHRRPPPARRYRPPTPTPTPHPSCTCEGPGQGGHRSGQAPSCTCEGPVRGRARDTKPGPTRPREQHRQLLAGAAPPPGAAPGAGLRRNQSPAECGLPHHLAAPASPLEHRESFSSPSTGTITSHARVRPPPSDGAKQLPQTYVESRTVQRHSVSQMWSRVPLHSPTPIQRTLACAHPLGCPWSVVGTSRCSLG
jgi:hypothetical protein